MTFFSDVTGNMLSNTVDLTGKPNELGYLMISDQLHKYLWPELEERPVIDRITRVEIRSVFSKFGNQYKFPPETPEYPGLSMALPKMPNLETFGDEYWAPLKDRVTKFITQGYPKMPMASDIIQQSGWTRYEPTNAPAKDIFDFDFSDTATNDNSEFTISRVPYPTEDELIFDCETFVKADNLSVMAVAVSNKAWYFWLHPSVINPNQDYQGELISLGYGKVVLNHNLKFDSARVLETYDFTKGPRNIWLDTMSMHMAVCGMSNKQRVPYKAYQKGSQTYASKWASVTSANSLVEVYNHHVKPRKPLQSSDKATRNIFVVATHCEQFKSRLSELIHYTLHDGKYTFELAEVLVPKYFRSQPSGYTLGGHAILSTSFLPVSPNFPQQLFRIEQKYLEVKKSLTKSLNKLAVELVQDFMAGKLDPTQDPWLTQMDWTPAKTGATKGQPFWWRKIKKKGVTIKSAIAPLLLKVSWKGQPITLTKEHGWVYPCTSVDHGAFEYEPHHGAPHFPPGFYAKIPHKKGDQQNCGSPLSKDYIVAIDNGTLSSPNPEAKSYLQAAKSIAYWSIMRKRAFDYRPQTMTLPDGTKWLMIEPTLVSHGTASRRCVEALWLTVSGAKSDVIGSELKGLVRTPPGWVSVNADFDAQELKIASSYSDVYRHRIWGSTPMGYTQLLGDKDQGTDGHTLLAKFLQFLDENNKVTKTGRGIAKNLNFQMLYLSGLAGCAGTIKAQRVDLSDEECRSIADKALKLRRGKKSRTSSGQFSYQGGTDSNAYNFMLDLANCNPLPRHLSHLQDKSKLPRTPMLRSAMSEAITSDNCGGDYLTSRANWGIQSSGVDLLHTFVTFLDYLFNHFQVQGFFMYPYHDEIWSMVKEEDKYKAALCFQIAHLWTWTLFFKRLGFTDMPFQYMFFSGVNIDTCFRKEVKDSQITPSNPEDVKHGEGLNIWQLLEHL